MNHNPAGSSASPPLGLVCSATRSPLRRMLLRAAVAVFAAACWRPCVLLGHNLNTSMTYLAFDADTVQRMQQRAALGQTLIQAGDVLGIVLKVTPGPGTATGVGGYMTFYIPDGMTVTKAEYVRPDPANPDILIPIPLKGQSIMPLGSGPVAVASSPALVGQSLGPNYLGVTELSVTAAGAHRGTVAGFYADTGIFYSTDPRTAVGSWVDGGGYDGNPVTSDNVLVSNSGDVIVPTTQWDAEQLIAYGLRSPALPVVDANGRGNAPWGMANAVAGPQSGYAWEFRRSVWLGTGDMQAATGVMGPWNRIRYPGSQISNDQAGLVSSVLGYAGIDASTVGWDMVGDGPLPGTTNAVRFSFGMLELGRSEYARVFVQVPTAYPCGFALSADTFGGDAGGENGGKDHVWRYYEPTQVSVNPCTVLQKVASRQVVAVGETFHYTITLLNGSASALTNVQIRDTLPSGLQFVSAIPAQESGPNPLAWSIPVVPADSVHAFTVYVKATGTGVLSNAAQAVSDEGTISAADTIEVGLRSLLRYDKTVSSASVVPGGTVTYTLTVHNDGTAANGTPLLIRELLPPGFAYAGMVGKSINGGLLADAFFSVNATNPNRPQFTVSTGIAPQKSLVLQFSATVGATVTTGTYYNTFYLQFENKVLGGNPLAPVTVGGARIGDTIWRDWNGDGAQDSGEEGIAGVTVALTYYGPDGVPGGGDDQILTDVTDANGAYLFAGLAAGNYQVAAPAPGSAGVPATYTLTGDPDGAPHALTHAVTLAADETYLAADWGYQPGGAGTVGSAVFDDADGNGALDAGESGIDGATVDLYEDTNGNGAVDAGDLLVGTAVTAGGGLYSFGGLDPDLSYLVQATDGTGSAIDTYYANPYSRTTPNPDSVSPADFLAAGNAYTGANFGYFGLLPAAIGGTVYYDADNDGIYDSGDDTPLPMVTARLYLDADGNGFPDSGELLATTETDALGGYRFDGLAPGAYIVVVDTGDPDLPVGSVVADSALTVSLAAGEEVATADFPVATLVNKTVDKETASGGENLVYTIEPNPAGSMPLANLTVVDALPGNTTFVSASHDYSLANGVVTWNLGSTVPAVQGTLTENPNIYAFRGGLTGDFWSYNVNTAAWTAQNAFGAAVGEGGALAYTGTGGDIFGLEGNLTRVFKRFNITSLPQFDWAARTDLASATNVSRGGALAALGGYVYALHGNDSAEFLRYEPATDTWTTRAPVPLPVGRGGALASDGTYLYAFSGDNSRNFFRYDPGANSWAQMANAPSQVGKPGAAGTRGGTALGRDRGSIYAMAGDGSTSFWRYHIASNTWSSTTPSGAPLAQVPVPVVQGGAMTLRSLRFYVLIGGGNLFYRYNIDDNTWIRLTDTPAAVAWGGALASVGGVAARETEMRATPYAVKDGDTVTVDVALSQCGFCPETLVGAAPPALTVTTTGGASVTYLSGPLPASQDIPIATTRHYAYTYQVQAGAANAPQSVTFSIPAPFDTGTPAATFSAAAANSVLVVPDLTLTVQVDALFAAGGIENTARLSGQPLDNDRNCHLLSSAACGEGVGRLERVDATGTTTDLGATGLDNAFALAWAPDRTYLYTANGNAFGWIDLNGGGFAEVGPVVATSGGNDDIYLEGADGNIAAGQIVVAGLAFDSGGLLYAVLRRAGDTDLLFRIDPATGRHVEDAFGAGRDYREILATSGRVDIEGIAFALDGTLHAVAANTGTPADGDLLVTIPSPDAASDTVQPVGVGNGLSPAGLLWVDADLDGIFDPGEQLYGVTGISISPADRAEIVTSGDAPAAFASSLLLLDVSRAEGEWMASPGACGYEALACLDHSVFGVPASAQTSVGNAIGDRVWLDADADGVQDAGEPGIAGVKVYLDVDDSGTWESGEPYALTALDGGYLIAGPANGSHVVRYDYATAPAGYVPTTPLSVTSVELTGTTLFLDADFGLRPPATASVGDTVWLDANEDGVVDAGETPLADIEVRIYADTDGDGVLDPGDVLVQTTSTDSDGQYLFASLAGTATAPVEYLVDVVETDPDFPSGLELVSGGASPVTGIHAVTIDLEGMSHLDADFGYNHAGQVGDLVYYDTDGDGTWDVGEEGVPDVSVMIFFDTSGNGAFDPGLDEIVAATATDATGNYLFDKLPDGTYFVEVATQTVANPGSCPDCQYTMVPTSGELATATVVAGSAELDADFGFLLAALVEGSVWSDANANGVRDGGEAGLSGITVWLDLDDDGTLDAGEPWTETDADGQYQFLVDAGTYVVRYWTADPDIPSGLALPTTPTSHLIEAVAGVEYLGLDFGLAYDGSVGDTVYANLDADLVQDPGEPGLAGVAVVLYRDLGTAGVLEPGTDLPLTMAVTDAGGHYLFTRPGRRQLSRRSPGRLDSARVQSRSRRRPDRAGRRPGRSRPRGRGEQPGHGLRLSAGRDRAFGQRDRLGRQRRGRRDRRQRRPGRRRAGPGRRRRDRRSGHRPRRDRGRDLHRADRRLRLLQRRRRSRRKLGDDHRRRGQPARLRLRPDLRSRRHARRHHQPHPRRRHRGRRRQPGLRLLAGPRQHCRHRGRRRRRQRRRRHRRDRPGRRRGVSALCRAGRHSRHGRRRHPDHGHDRRGRLCLRRSRTGSLRDHHRRTGRTLRPGRCRRWHPVQHLLQPGHRRRRNRPGFRDAVGPSQRRGVLR